MALILALPPAVPCPQQPHPSREGDLALPSARPPARRRVCLTDLREAQRLSLWFPTLSGAPGVGPEGGAALDHWPGTLPPDHPALPAARTVWFLANHPNGAAGAFRLDDLLRLSPGDKVAFLNWLQDPKVYLPPLEEMR